MTLFRFEVFSRDSPASSTQGRYHSSLRAISLPDLSVEERFCQGDLS